MRLNIIVEGPDGTGKSTLVNSLSGIYNIDVHHIGNPITDEDFKHELSLMYKSINDGLIIDRLSHISECVYSKVFNRKPRVEFEIPKALENWKIIFCFVKKSNVEYGKSYKSDEWYRSIEKRSSDIANEYNNIFNMLLSKYPNRVISYDYTKDSICKLLNFINGVDLE